MTAPGLPRASVVTVGDELLLGDRVDTNATWLARFLSDAGFQVVAHHSVRDVEAEIADALRRAASQGEAVVVTGGLGPTLDDLTRDASVHVFGGRMIEDPSLRDWLKARSISRGESGLSPLNHRLTFRPERATPILNPVGSAPALIGAVPKSAGSWILLLPGVPSEMKALMEGEAGERLLAPFRDRLFPPSSRLIHTSGIPESRLAREIERRLPGDLGVGVAYRPSLVGVELRLTARPGDPMGALDAAESLLSDLLTPYRYESSTGDLAEAVGKGLMDAKWTIGVGESCTGGLVTRRLTETPGSSRYVRGGVVAYANDIKVDLLQLPEALLVQEGAVSEPAARALAEGARTRFQAEVGVGVTGIAGPSGATEGKPVGTVWFGLALPTGTHAEEVRFPGTRHEVRERAAQHALLLVHRALHSHASGAPKNSDLGGGYSTD